mgnify:CR=1 FL=1
MAQLVESTRGLFTKEIPPDRLAYEVKQFVGQNVTRVNRVVVLASDEAGDMAFEHLRLWLNKAQKLRLGHRIGPSYSDSLRMLGEPSRRQTLLRSVEASFARYGDDLVTKVEVVVGRGLSLGWEPGRVALELTGTEGPLEGQALWKALRISNTELMRQYNLSGLEAIRRAAKVRPTLLKRLVEHVNDDGEPTDDKVGKDSIRLHGQVRTIDGMFSDSLSGQLFSIPPGRPNDRSVLTPWDALWGFPPLVDPEGASVIRSFVPGQDIT